ELLVGRLAGACRLPDRHAELQDRRHQQGWPVGDLRAVQGLPQPTHHHRVGPMRISPLLGLVLALFLSPAVALSAPRADALGPVATLAEPRDGFVGSIAASPANGPAGTSVTVTGEGFVAGEPLEL